MIPVGRRGATVRCPAPTPRPSIVIMAIAERSPGGTLEEIA